MANETNPVFGSNPNVDRSLGAGLHQLRSKWGWIVASGVVFLIGGVLAFGYTGLATLASIFVLGVALIAAGCAETLLAFNMRDWPHFLMWLVLGIVTIVAGMLALANPGLTAVVYTWLLAAALVGIGIARVVLSFRLPKDAPWFMITLSGLIAFALGLMIFARWPWSSVYTLGIFMAVDLMFAGIGWITLGLRLRPGGGPSRHA
jgi:uncharacterized membrane protein HdeD (DUF308 family)